MRAALRWWMNAVRHTNWHHCVPQLSTLDIYSRVKVVQWNIAIFWARWFKIEFFAGVVLATWNIRYFFRALFSSQSTVEQLCTINHALKKTPGQTTIFSPLFTASKKKKKNHGFSSLWKKKAFYFTCHKFGKRFTLSLQREASKISKR